MTSDKKVESTYNNIVSVNNAYFFWGGEGGGGGGGGVGLAVISLYKDKCESSGAALFSTADPGISSSKAEPLKFYGDWS